MLETYWLLFFLDIGYQCTPISSNEKLFEQTIYAKASLVIRMLQEMVGGKDILFEKIRSYLLEHVDQNVVQVWL